MRLAQWYQTKQNNVYCSLRSSLQFSVRSTIFSQAENTRWIYWKNKTKKFFYSLSSRCCEHVKSNSSSNGNLETRNGVRMGGKTNVIKIFFTSTVWLPPLMVWIFNSNALACDDWKWINFNLYVVREDALSLVQVSNCSRTWWWVDPAVERKYCKYWWCEASSRGEKCMMNILTTLWPSCDFKMLIGVRSSVAK